MRNVEYTAPGLEIIMRSGVLYVSHLSLLTSHLSKLFLVFPKNAPSDHTKHNRGQGRELNAERLVGTFSKQEEGGKNEVGQRNTHLHHKSPHAEEHTRHLLPAVALFLFHLVADDSIGQNAKYG